MQLMTSLTPYHTMCNGIVENFNKTIKNLLKKVTAEKPKDRQRYLGPLMFAVRDTPQDSTGFTLFELLYGYQVRTPMTLNQPWQGENISHKYVETIFLPWQWYCVINCNLQGVRKFQRAEQNYSFWSWTDDVTWWHISKISGFSNIQHIRF